jgi:hypothetical protein
MKTPIFPIAAVAAILALYGGRDVPSGRGVEILSVIHSGPIAIFGLFVTGSNEIAHVAAIHD